MSRPHAIAVVASCASVLLFACPAQAQTKPAMSWQPASSSNYSGRGGTKIDMIVIHKAEGTLDGTVSWFKNPASKVSAHYCTDDNSIAQTVQDAEDAWHCGNGAYNHRSIGIENSGYTDRDDFTDVHYRRLATLVAYLCAEHGIPVDRQHIIGHNEVPDPDHPGKFGGSNGHMDPGPYFNWTLFMSYVNGGTSAPAPAPATATATATQPSPPAAAPSGGTQAVSVTGDSVNVRDGAWGTIIGTAPQSTGWVRTGNEDQGFVEVYFRGKTGWISASLTTGYSGPGSQINVDQANVRDGSSTSATIVAHAGVNQVYAAGDPSSDGAWITIRFDENRRWVYKASTTDVTLAP